MNDKYILTCPKCGSTNINSEQVRFEPRSYWCADCGEGDNLPTTRKTHFKPKIKVIP